MLVQTHIVQPSALQHPKPTPPNPRSNRYKYRPAGQFGAVVLRCAREVAVKVKTLRSLNRGGEYGKKMDRIHALYEGGEDWRKLLDFWLPTTVLEPVAVKDERHKWATYDPHLPVIVNLTLGNLFADDPTMDGLPDDVWGRLSANCDRQDTSWAEFFRSRMCDAILYRRAWVWVETPRSEQAPATLADENAVVANVYLRAIDARSVQTWSRDATGKLDAVLFHDCVDEVTDIAAPPVKVHRWTAIDAVRIRRWEWRSTEFKDKPDDEDDAQQLDDIAHGYGRIPVSMYELEHDQWLGGRLHDPCVAHVRADNELRWTIHRAAHEMLVITSREESKKPIVGTLQWLQLHTFADGPADKAEYVGPSGRSIDKQILAEQTAKTAIYRAAQHLHIAANPTAAGALQSAEAKSRDMEATGLLLESYTKGILDFMTEVGKLIAVVLGIDGTEVMAGGLRGEEDKDPKAWLESAALAVDLVGASPTAAKLIMLKQATVLLDDLDPETIDQIEDEIEAYLAGQTPGTGASVEAPDPNQPDPETPEGAGDAAE